MKSTITFALLALGSAAAPQEDAAPQEAAPQEAAPQESYGAQEAAPQESYGAEPTQTYAAADYAPAAAYVAAPKVCVVCDDRAPCWNGASCVARVASEEPHYASSFAYNAAPAHEQGGKGGYRRLRDGTYAQAGSQGYAQEVHSGGEHYKAPRVSTSCPCGTVDTRHYEVHNRAILWVAFGLLFLPALYFMYRGYDDIDGGHKGWNAVRMGAGIVCMVASLAYVTMALGYGYVTKCNGRDFYYARYIDWAITTPLILWELVNLAEKEDGGDELMQVFLVLMDIFMIVAGLIGELVTGDEKWAFFGFAMLAFLPIMYFLSKIASDVAAGSGCCGGANAGPVRRLLRNVVSLTLFTWIGYPIIWILASVNTSVHSCGFATEAAQSSGYRALQYAASAVGSVNQVGVISVQGEAYAYTVLDVLAKSAVGWLIVSHTPACDCPETPECSKKY